jgi:hypothetical protein
MRRRMASQESRNVRQLGNDIGQVVGHLADNKNSERPF